MTIIMRSMGPVCLACAVLVGTASGESVRGLFLGVRSGEPLTGPSRQDSEFPVVGDKAVLAWKVRQGSYHAARLDGFAVVALVCGDGPIGSDEKVQTRTTFIVDERATPAQQAALIAMAKALAGAIIQEVVEVTQMKINLTVCQGCAAGYASLEAGPVRIRTRRLSESERVKPGGGDTAEPVLAKLYYRYSAYALEYSYSGSDYQGNPARFSLRDLRSAAVGGFWL